ncbi:MAG: NlpC/P60 family protein [Alphaproteobacteria bacterium]|nr:NlpC/P60 family protein [Alphaproteobacteria bacterium]MBM3640943.1 NlpC/P60 family protein [Alphaproteobacteria bacterium]
MSEAFDRRLTPARPEIAAAYLKGRVTADRYVEGVAMEVRDCVVDLRREPRPDAAIDTQALYGERVTVYDEEEGWAWAQLARDNYVGWIAANTLWRELSAPTHRICVPRTFIYPGPNIKLPLLNALPLGAEVAIAEERDGFCVTPELGFIYRKHLAPRETKAPDFVAVAEMLIGAPYLWGGKSWMGVDCSGLLQVSLLMAGVKAPRDTDMQEAALGERLAPTTPLMRGDIVFWKGHVGIMRNAETLLHANATHMQVTSEPLDVVRSRNEAGGAGPITSVKRLAKDV